MKLRTRDRISRVPLLAGETTDNRLTLGRHGDPGGDSYVEMMLGANTPLVIGKWPSQIQGLKF